MGGVGLAVVDEHVAGGHTIFSRYFNYPDSHFERLIGWYALHDSPETEFVDELAPYLSDPRAHFIDKTI